MVYSHPLSVLSVALILQSLHSEYFQFQLGSVTLKSRADSAILITQIFNHCIESMEELKSRIQRLETDNQRISQERINALKVRHLHVIFLSIKFRGSIKVSSYCFGVGWSVTLSQKFCAVNNFLLFLTDCS